MDLTENQSFTYRVEPSLIQVNKKYDIVSKTSNPEKIHFNSIKGFYFFM